MENALSVFLKFISSVVPTIESDFTADLDFGGDKAKCFLIIQPRHICFLGFGARWCFLISSNTLLASNVTLF